MRNSFNNNFKQKRPFADELIIIGLKHNSIDDIVKYSVTELYMKINYFVEHYPFENKPSIFEEVECIHCQVKYKVIHFRMDEENRICCGNPDCDGTVIDWMKEEKTN